MSVFARARVRVCTCLLVCLVCCLRYVREIPLEICEVWSLHASVQMS